MIRLYRAEELPPEVPGALFTDGENTVILINARHMISTERGAWLREVLNSLLAEASRGPSERLRSAV